MRTHLSRVYLDRGGYDAWGTYWGVDLPLYCATSPEGDTKHVRGRTRELAKEIYRSSYDRNARFYR